MTSMRFLYLAAFSVVVLAGAGCTASPATYIEYRDQSTGVGFEIPSGATAVSDGVNGFEDVWKFTYNGDTYMVSFNEYNGRAIYANWEMLTNAQVTVTENGDKTVYSENGVARTEVFMSKNDPSASISVTKHEGTALTGDLSASDDEAYRHLVSSVTINQVLAF
jgi:hypothetical protein